MRSVSGCASACLRQRPEALERNSNIAEALLVYDRLRVPLRDELGIAPGPAVQSIRERLLATTA